MTPGKKTSPEPEEESPDPAAAESEEGGAKAERARLLAALWTGLEEVLPGLHLLDRDLVFDEGVAADLAGADAARRLVLVLIAEEDADRVTLQAIDLAAHAARHAAVIARHLEGDHVDPTLGPRTVVVDPHGTPRLGARLSLLTAGGVELFGLQSIKSAAGDRSYLVRLSGEGAGPPALDEDAVESFVASLPSELADIGGLAVARIARLDRELITEGRAGLLAWRLHGDSLVRLEVVGEELHGSVGPRFEARRIVEERDLDPLLEEALALLVDLPGNGAESREEEEPGTGGVAFPLLTEEEIGFFRE